MKFIKKLTKKIVIALLALIMIAIPLIYLTVINSREASASWYNDNWAYRQAIPVTSTNGSAQTNVFISFTLDTATAITNGKLQGSCQDIRITDVGGKLLPYHVGRTNACNNAATTIDFLLASFPDGTSTYYVYYGNPSVTSADAGAFSQSQASNYSIGTLATAEKAPGPIAYWKFDEGTGTTTKDSTQNANNGTLGGTTIPTWQTEDQCVSGKCLYFDGSTSKVTGSAAATNIQTISFWVRPNTIASQGIFNLDGGTHTINTNSSGTVAANNFTSPTYYINGNATATPTLVLNQWNFVEITTGTGFNSTSSFTLGTDGTNFIKGFIDDVKFYNYARSAAQVLTDYSSRGSVKGSSTSIGSPSTGSGRLADGLIGYWKMDESSGNTSDSSGNGTTLTNNNTTTYAAGKFGNGGSFAKASTQYFSAADSSTLRVGTGNFTISSWVYLNSATIEMAIASKYDTASKREWDLEYNFVAQRFRFVMSPDGTAVTNVNADNLGVPVTGQWYFVVGWYDGVNINISVNNGTPNSTAYTTGTTGSTAPFEIGGLLVNGATTLTWNGQIDDVRLYKRALSSADITALYNFAPGPRVYLKMDEGSGTSANDSSGNARTGTINGNPIWAPGKYGAGLKMDGTGDDISVGDF